MIWLYSFMGFVEWSAYVFNIYLVVICILAYTCQELRKMTQKVPCWRPPDVVNDIRVLNVISGIAPWSQYSHFHTIMFYEHTFRQLLQAHWYLKVTKLWTFSAAKGFSQICCFALIINLSLFFDFYLQKTHS